VARWALGLPLTLQPCGVGAFEGGEFTDAIRSLEFL
jgi:hypothetical protein